MYIQYCKNTILHNVILTNCILESQNSTLYGFCCINIQKYEANVPKLLRQTPLRQTDKTVF